MGLDEASIPGRKKMPKTIYAAVQVPDETDVAVVAADIAKAVGVGPDTVAVATNAISLMQSMMEMRVGNRRKMESARTIAAEDAFGTYDFGSEVEGSDGWESTIPGDETTRKVYLAPDAAEGDGDAGDTWACTFVVRFTPMTAIVSECYAIDAGGNILRGVGNIAARA